MQAEINSTTSSERTSAWFGMTIVTTQRSHGNASRHTAFCQIKRWGFLEERQNKLSRSPIFCVCGHFPAFFGFLGRFWPHFGRANDKAHPVDSDKMRCVFLEYLWKAVFLIDDTALCASPFKLGDQGQTIVVEVTNTRT